MLLFCKDTLKVTENTYKYLFWTLFIKESLKMKCITVSTKILSSTVFNIDNKKCFFKSAYCSDLHIPIFQSNNNKLIAKIFIND